MASDRRAENRKRVAELTDGVILIAAQQKRLVRGGLLPGHPIHPQLPAVCQPDGKIERHLIDVERPGVAVEVIPEERKVELAFIERARRKSIEEAGAAEYRRGALALGDVAEVVNVLRPYNTGRQEQREGKSAGSQYGFHNWSPASFRRDVRWRFGEAAPPGRRRRQTMATA